MPWLDFFPAGTPAHPEYPSGHSTVSGSAAFILAAAFGDNTAFSVTSDVRLGTRTFSSFSEAVAEIANARVFGGIHFRTSCVRGNTLGRAVGITCRDTRCVRLAMTKTMKKIRRKGSIIRREWRSNPML